MNFVQGLSVCLLWSINRINFDAVTSSLQLHTLFTWFLWTIHKIQFSSREKPKLLTLLLKEEKGSKCCYLNIYLQFILELLITLPQMKRTFRLVHTNKPESDLLIEPRTQIPLQTWPLRSRAGFILKGTAGNPSVLTISVNHPINEIEGPAASGLLIELCPSRCVCPSQVMIHRPKQQQQRRLQTVQRTRRSQLRDVKRQIWCLIQDPDQW